MTESQPLPSVLYASHIKEWGGGGEIVLEQLIRVAGRLGYSPSLVGPEGEATRRLSELCDAAAVVPFAETRRSPNPLTNAALAIQWLISTFRLLAVVRRFKPSIIHANSSTAALNLCVPAFLTRRPLIWHQHDIVPNRRANRVVLGLCARLSTNILACSHAVRDSLLELQIDGTKVEVVYNGVRPQFLDPLPEKSTSRQDLGLPEDAQVLTVIGRLVPRKGQAIFLQALEILLEEGCDAYGILAGEAPSAGPVASMYADYRQKLLTMAGRSRLAGRVKFLGHRDDIRTVLAASDVFVLPSFNEPFPLTILEASATRVPVVASASGGNEELIEHGSTGLLARPGDPKDLAANVLGILRDGELRERLVRRARERVKTELNEQIFDDRIARVYAKILYSRGTALPVRASTST